MEVSAFKGSSAVTLRDVISDLKLNGILAKV